MMLPGMLTSLILIPIVGALAILVLRGDDHKFIKGLALGVSLFEFGFSLLLLLPRNMKFAVAGYQLEENFHWITSPPIRYHLGVDGLSVFLVILTTFLTAISVIASWNNIHERIKEFFVMLLMLEVGIVGVFLSLDLFLFFLFWEVMLIPMAFLIGIWGHGRKIYAAVKFVLYTMAGSILMLVGIVWLYNLTGSFDLVDVQRALQPGGVSLTSLQELLLFLAFFVAFAIKVPLFPLHTWLPDAHVEAPTAGSVILAGVLLKMGTYGMMRFCLPLFPHASKNAAPYVAVFAIIGIIYGALVALVQPNLKKLVAYSSVSHLGFVVLGIFTFGTIGMQGAIYQMLAHGISTGALFLLVGMLYDRRHTFEISDYGGLATPMPRFSAFFLFVALSSLGLPILNGFVGEYLILLGTYTVNWKWAAWAALGVILSACYLLWAYQRVFFGDVTHAENKELPDASLRERGILFAMAVVTLWMGVGSAYLTHRTATATDTIRRQMGDVLQEAEKPASGSSVKISLDSTTTPGCTSVSPVEAGTTCTESHRFLPFSAALASQRPAQAGAPVLQTPPERSGTR
ncbi:MAG TPA: NADH-quinone oxidoreductase subunit M [Candidatus Acidoferrum sp.]|nr:NADH-quinone oxidoreductase subunit M [Candidatus Acidoferrum sp.]